MTLHGSIDIKLTPDQRAALAGYYVERMAANGGATGGGLIADPVLYTMTKRDGTMRVSFLTRAELVRINAVLADIAEARLDANGATP